MTLPSFLEKQIIKGQKPNNGGKSGWQNSWKISTDKIIKWWHPGLVRNVHGICSHQAQMSCDLIILNMLYIFIKYVVCILCHFKKIIYLFGHTGSSFLCTDFFSSCREWGLLSSCSAWASHCSTFSCCQAQPLGTWTSIVASRSSVVAIRGF